MKNPVQRNYLILFLLMITAIFLLSSCSSILAKSMGVKKPKPTTNAQVIQFLRDNNIDYDYVVRPNSDSALQAITRYMKTGFNSIVVYDNAGNELGNTNDSTCHLRLRSQITDMLKAGKYDGPKGNKNIKSLIGDNTQCLNCEGSKDLFAQQLKPYIIILGSATFIPIKEKLSDLDYVQELKAQGLRDKATIVVLDADMH